MSESFLNGRVVLHAGDSREVLKTLADNSIDSIVTDPPYALVSVVKRFGKATADSEKFAMTKARLGDAVPDHGPLFGGLDPIAEAAE